MIALTDSCLYLAAFCSRMFAWIVLKWTLSSGARSQTRHMSLSQLRVGSSNWIARLIRSSHLASQLAGPPVGQSASSMFISLRYSNWIFCYCEICTKCAGSVREISTIDYLHLTQTLAGFDPNYLRVVFMNVKRNAMNSISKWHFYNVWLSLYEFSKFNEICE